MITRATLPPAQPDVLARKKLPIGIHTFRTIREDDCYCYCYCYCVDKSDRAVDLIKTGKTYFLSRPRRFGTSLFFDLLKELVDGNQALLTGLAAEPLWSRSTRPADIWSGLTSRRFSTE